jgi:glycyl-tRNA synthetase beta chain
MSVQNLLVELFVEELPPKALNKLGSAFSAVLAEQLKAQGLVAADAVVTAFASPRRLAAHVTGVRTQAADKPMQQKLMPVAVGLDAAGNATPALLKKLQALGADVSDSAAAVAALKRQPDGKAEALFYDSVVQGATLSAGLQKALDEALAKLPIPKVMQYQLETDCELPGWSSVNFVRPAHSLIALHGSSVVPVKTLGLTAGNSTKGHRFEAKLSTVVVPHADQYDEVLKRDGSVIASFAERRADIVRQLQAAAAKVGGGVHPIDDEALVDEVTALVERPNVLICEFEKQFLDVPQECLILTMKANQKYFPLLEASRQTMHRPWSVATSAWCARAWPMPNSFLTKTEKRRSSRALKACPKWCTTTSWARRASAWSASVRLPKGLPRRCASNWPMTKVVMFLQRKPNRPRVSPRPIC